jgi:hypothetical protein
MPNTKKGRNLQAKSGFFDRCYAVFSTERVPGRPNASHLPFVSW